MAEPDRPQSPFAEMADLSARTRVRILSPIEIERMLAEHRLYQETEYPPAQRGMVWEFAARRGWRESNLDQRPAKSRSPKGEWSSTLPSPRRLAQLIRATRWVND